MTWLLAVYVAGVCCGLVFTDARPPARVGLALLWPAGPLAFLVTVTFLVLIAPVALLGRGAQAGRRSG